MSIQDKLSMWELLLTEDDAEAKPTDLFEGVGDDEDELDQHILFTYCRSLSNSESFKWLISSLTKASAFHWDDCQPQTMVRSQILAALPTGTLCSNHGPLFHTACFELPKLPIILRLSEERTRRNVKRVEDAIFGALVAIGSSSSQIQVTTVHQYLDQTWSMGWPELLEVLVQAIGDPNENPYTSESPSFDWQFASKNLSYTP